MTNIPVWPLEMKHPARQRRQNRGKAETDFFKFPEFLETGLL